MSAQDVAKEAWNFGEIIKGARRNSGMTLKQLEAVSGVSFKTISHWEHGHMPAVDKLDRVLEALGISITIGRK